MPTIASLEDLKAVQNHLRSMFLTVFRLQLAPYDLRLRMTLCDVLINTRLPEKYRREQMEYFKKEAEGLMKMRKSGHLPDDKI